MLSREMPLVLIACFTLGWLPEPCYMALLLLRQFTTEPRQPILLSAIYRKKLLPEWLSQGK
uniref:Uncharacterized protein n=1 Tax=Yersinia enterocolitica TaxID=630 RepID=B0RKR7_YEREN|nr:hypothetical protein [Yersinia enterocolitica]